MHQGIAKDGSDLVPRVVVPEVERVLLTADNWKFDSLLLHDVTQGHPLSTLGFWIMQQTDMVKQFGMLHLLNVNAKTAKPTQPLVGVHRAGRSEAGAVFEADRRGIVSFVCPTFSTCAVCGNRNQILLWHAAPRTPTTTVRMRLTCCSRCTC